MANGGRTDEGLPPEVAEMLAELEGREPSAAAASGFQAESGRTSASFPPRFAATGSKGASTPRWPARFAANGGKFAPPRWPGRFLASGGKTAR